MSVQSPLGATKTGAFDLRAPTEIRSSGLDAPVVASAVFDPPAALPAPGIELPIHRPALALRERLRSREAVGLIALAGVFGCGLLIVIAAAGTDSFVPETVRPVPAFLAGPLGSARVNIGVVGVLLVFAGMFACYAIALEASNRLSARAVLLTIVGLHAVLLLGPTLLSTDAFSYQIYGRMGALYNTSPYTHGPHAIALDSLYPFIDSKWVSTPSAYGPLFTALSYVLAPLTIATSALTYKALATVASLLTVGLLWHAAKLRGVNQVRAIALFGLNPLIVVYGVGGGHNDLLMLVLLVAAIVAALHFRDRASGGLIVVASAIKLTGALLLPFVMAHDWATKRGRRRFDALAGAGIATVAVGALSFAMFGTGPLHLPATLQHIQNEGDWHSIPGFITTRLGLGGVGRVTGIGLAVIFVIVFVTLLRRVARNELDWIHAAGWATVALLLTTSSLLPWYVAWLVPFAALATDRRLFKTAIVLTGVIQGIQLLGYIPHGSSWLGL
jgi:hypothetical protein